MKNTITYSAIFIVLLLIFGLPSCIKDKCTQTYQYTIYEPRYKTKADVRANIKSNEARAVQTPGKIFIQGNYIFLNEVDKGIHVINNTDPSHPVNSSFIDIPGNIDIAVKGNTLYADLYTALVTLDITDPSHVILKKINENVFPYRAYTGSYQLDSSKVIVDWYKHDTTITMSCYMGDVGLLYSSVLTPNASGQGSSSNSSPVGKAGSMAKFALMGNRLYTVTESAIDAFNISNSNDPLLTNHTDIGWDIETIYPFRNKLFIGSRTGMMIYDVSNPDHPSPDGQFSHVRSCDPVIADNDYAYVTLRSGSRCEGFSNELEILSISFLINPTLIKVYPFTNPQGLSKDGNTLFICDGKDGLKIYDATDVNHLNQIRKFSGFNAYDVIAFNNIALVVGADGLYQYDYSNLSDIQLLSSIPVQKM